MAFMKNMMTVMMSVMMDSLSPDEKQDTMLKLMPGMLKEVKGSDIMDIINQKVSEMMFQTYKSRFSFSETIQTIKQRGQDAGWYNPTINNHYEIEESLGLSEPNKVATISMCLPRCAANILKANIKLGVMMPMQINVYEDHDQVYVTWMNMSLMGKLFGNTVSDIMEKADKILRGVLAEIIDNKEQL